VLILDLCGGSGSWSQPYKDAGYDVIVVDPIVGTGRVQDFTVPADVHGILAAPPCTEFSQAGARWWKSKAATKPYLLADAVDTVNACMSIIQEAKPKWWALENPLGRITTYLGNPAWRFHPWEYGDPWQKRTCIWGKHVIPPKTPIKWPPSGTRPAGPLLLLSPKPTRKQIELLVSWGMVPTDWEKRWGPTPSRELLRSLTPPSFAAAFFKANP